MTASGITNVSPNSRLKRVGDVAGQLDVLALIVPYRHLVGAVQYDVPGHENGIVEQSGGHALHSGGLVLVLGHALQPADGRDAVENPARLGMGGDVALDEQRALVRAKTAGEQHRGQLAGLAAQILRIERRGDRVEVHDAEEVLLIVLLLDPLLERADVVAELRVAAGLDAAKDAAPYRGLSGPFDRCR